MFDFQFLLHTCTCRCICGGNKFAEQHFAEGSHPLPAAMPPKFHLTTIHKVALAVAVPITAGLLYFLLYRDDGESLLVPGNTELNKFHCWSFMSIISYINRDVHSHSPARHGESTLEGANADSASPAMLATVYFCSIW